MAGVFDLSPVLPLPPRGEEDRLARLRLLRSPRIGPVAYRRLIHEHGSAAQALDALPEVARASGIPGYAPCSRAAAVAEVRAARAAGARALFQGEPGYPPALAAIPDAPPMLWSRGDPSLTERPAVAVVGARNASSLGTRTAQALAAALGEAGFAVVSGLARGIDTVAHRAALDRGTIAVLAGGADVIYPAQNADLANEIVARGLILSERPMGLQPRAQDFPRRNRIVSGLARAVIVIEAAARSGTLITARAALDQGREVLAVPGHPLDPRAAGCNALIRDGATLVRGIEDVIEAIGSAEEPTVAQREFASSEAPSAPARRPRIERAAPTSEALPTRRPLAEAAEVRAAILALIGPSPLAEDQLIRDLPFPAERVLPEILMLELDGRLERRPGGFLALAG